MSGQFKTDFFHVYTKMDEQMEKEIEARIKEYDSCVLIAGKRVAATVEFRDGCVLVDVETPVVYL